MPTLPIKLRYYELKKQLIDKYNVDYIYRIIIYNNDSVDYSFDIYIYDKENVIAEAYNNKYNKIKNAFVGFCNYENCYNIEYNETSNWLKFSKRNKPIGAYTNIFDSEFSDELLNKIINFLKTT